MLLSPLLNEVERLHTIPIHLRQQTHQVLKTSTGKALKDLERSINVTTAGLVYGRQCRKKRLSEADDSQTG